MTDEPKDVRLPLMVSRTELAAIDEWRFKSRVPSRAEAIRRLIEAGLKAENEKPLPSAEKINEVLR